MREEYFVADVVLCGTRLCQISAEVEFSVCVQKCRAHRYLCALSVALLHATN